MSGQQMNIKRALLFRPGGTEVEEIPGNEILHVQPGLIVMRDRERPTMQVHFHGSFVVEMEPTMIATPRLVGA